ncbi:MAG: bifunctional 2-C-methyl-D-erythritol 4-phosphate cytidylyltransferase/2-C-methyl-D-erythritol 2,4-cyclodiphosphate synthase [Sphingomonas sp.]
MTRPRIAAIIVAAGKGLRSGGPPKQFTPLAGKPMIAHSHERLSAHPAIDEVLVVIGAGQEDALRAALGDEVAFVIGGAARRDSVLAGLSALGAGITPDRVLIHDAARPFVPAALIDRLLAALDDTPGAVPALAVADTLARRDGMLGETVSRDGLVRVQTPQAFHFGAIIDAHRRWPADREATDDAQMLRHAGGTVAIVEGDTMLEKVTYPADFATAEARLGTAPRVRTATGYDVHRLVAGEELWLGGVLIPHDKGLSGHSDADVALHAITDALLGTIAAGDIGTHFPPTDPQWRGADSAQFLRHAASLVAAEGGVIDFIDLTLICERPKVGPYRPQMRARIAELLRLDERQVSVKATTTERLGFTGRGEGIAAQAVATVRVA